MADDDQQDPPAKGEDEQDPKNDLGDAGKRALAAERDARKQAEKKAKDLEDRLQAIEDKDKSEVERLTEQVSALTKERDAAVGKFDRLEVAVLKSLDDDRATRITSAAKRLTGASREELEADADEFLTAFAVPDRDATSDDDPKPTPTGKPREQLKPGSGDPETPVEETDIKKLGERMFAS